VVKESQILRFGEFELDERRQELRRDGEIVLLHGTPMRLLRYLLDKRDRLVTKEQLLEEVWPDVAVSDAALSTALKQIRPCARRRWSATAMDSDAARMGIPVCR
jgi:DNA-binding winged helix-turn-helix (wHTH) protein